MGFGEWLLHFGIAKISRRLGAWWSVQRRIHQRYTSLLVDTDRCAFFLFHAKFEDGLSVLKNRATCHRNLELGIVSKKVKYI
jgi:hypothetical protein